MSVTHVAGPVVCFSKLDRLIQRCAVCGEKLEDLRPSCVGVISTSGRLDVPQFAETHLIRVEQGENATCYFDLGDFRTAALPKDFCLDLVER